MNKKQLVEATILFAIFLLFLISFYGGWLLGEWVKGL